MEVAGSDAFLRCSCHHSKFLSPRETAPTPHGPLQALPHILTFACRLFAGALFLFCVPLFVCPFIVFQARPRQVRIWQLLPLLLLRLQPVPQIVAPGLVPTSGQLIAIHILAPKAVLSSPGSRSDRRPRGSYCLSNAGYSLSVQKW